MANPTWASTGLPDDVLVDGYDERPPETRVRTQMDAGPDKVRRRATANVRPIRCTSDVFTRADVATLDAFFVTTLEGGALPFDWTHPRTQAAVTFRFVELPRYRPTGSGVNWHVDLDLEVMP